MLPILHIGGVTGVRLHVYQINRTEAINTRGKSLAQEVQLQAAITPTHHRVIVHSFHSIKHNPKYQIGQVGIALEKSALQQKRHRHLAVGDNLLEDTSQAFALLEAGPTIPHPECCSIR